MERMVGMMRDHWWWPWWVSSLIDVGVVVLALFVFWRSSRRAVRALAALFVLGGLVAAVLAPIVMTEETDRMKNEAPMMP
jgi:lipoprotein signal peptidase